MDKTLTIRPPRAVTHDADVLSLVDDWHRAMTLQVESGEISDTTRRAYQVGMDKFLTWWTDNDGGQVDGDTLRRWIADLKRQGRKPNSINTWRAGVRAFFTWAVGAHRLIYNPTLGVKGAKRKGTKRKHKRDALTDTEVRRVLAQPDTSTPEGKRDKAILVLMAYTAARTIELHRADLADLSTQDGRLVLKVQGKGDVESDDLLVLANPAAEAALYDWLAARGNKPGPLFTSLSNRSRGDRLSLRSFRELVKGYYRSAGIQASNKTTHSLRHAAITNAVRHGAPIQKVQSMARHASLDTTMIYFHETDRIDNPAEQFISYDNGK
jgi:integrase/recombinase XerD